MYMYIYIYIHKQISPWNMPMVLFFLRCSRDCIMSSLQMPVIYIPIFSSLASRLPGAGEINLKDMGKIDWHQTTTNHNNTGTIWAFLGMQYYVI